jgi:hypothetical protein
MTGMALELSSRIEELPGIQSGGYDRARQATSRMGVRRVMQNYCCQHCGISSESTFELFLHIFTDHLHKDIAIEAQQVREIIQKMYPYLVADYAYSPN